MNGFRARPLLVAFLLLLATAAVYWPAGGYPFVHFDDPVYVTANPLVNRGLTGEAVRAAFTAVRNDNWHPLTWLSHMLDVQLFGMNAGGHHLVSVGLHGLTAAALFGALLAMTGQLLPAAAAAALFAVHPLHVEPVVWIAERKEVLAALCFALAIGAYARYVRRPGPSRYLPVLLLFLLGLLAKPMVVTFPAVLLLLDAWPLGRWRALRPAALLAEKLPLLLLAAASAGVTVSAQSGTAIKTLADYPLSLRVENAAWSYAWYLVKTIWPSGLAFFYPHPKGGLGGWEVLAAAALLAAATAAVIAYRRRAPWLAVGWFWFAGMLVPVIGLVQVGLQGRADRYHYLPSVGLFVAAAWGAARLAGRDARRRAAVGVAGSLVLAALAGAAMTQVRLWRDNSTIFRRALAVTEANAVAHGMLGYTLFQEGRVDEALVEFVACDRLDPGNQMVRRYLELYGVPVQGRPAPP